MFVFITVALVGFTLSRLGAILVGITTPVGDIAGKLTGNSRFVNPDNFSDFSLSVPCLEQSMNGMTIL